MICFIKSRTRLLFARMAASAAFVVLLAFPGTIAAQQAGYLADGAFDVLAVLPPAPVKGDARYDADRKMFLETRSLVGTPRYALATSDVDTGTPAMLRDFSCAVGVTLTPQNAPKTMVVAQRASTDASRQTSRAKDYYKRQRPFLIDAGAICQDRSQLNSYDYPSGHTTHGWTWAMILAQLAPDRATQILARGRAYGESRMVCGVHNQSAVEAGWLSASATMAAVEATDAFQADLAAAKSEMNALRADPDAARPEGCAAEQALVAHTPFKTGSGN